MIIGIDGNCWYASNGLCLGDWRSKFGFSEKLGDAIAEYQKMSDTLEQCPPDMVKYLDVTATEYKTQIAAHEKESKA